jgi:yeast amino acid transporter
LAGTELVGLAAAETDNPRKTIPQAAKQVFWRIILFYITSIFIVGCIVPYTHPQLLSSEHSADMRASPFVIAIQEAGIKGLPSVINAVILIAALSVGNSSTYASSRTIQALGDVRQAPKIFGYVDMWGRPLAGQILALMCGTLAYFSCLPGGASQMFDWLLQISALSSFFTWGSICLAHIRFRAAMKKQAESIDLLPFRACFGIYGSYLALTINFLCIVVQVYLGFSPIRGSLTVEGCLMDVIAVPVIIGFYVVRRVCKRKDGWVRLEDMDLISGRKDNLVLAHAEDVAQRATWGCGRTVFHWFC